MLDHRKSTTEIRKVPQARAHEYRLFVELDLVQPVRPGRRPLGQRRLARQDEAVGLGGRELLGSTSFDGHHPRHAIIGGTWFGGGAHRIAVRPICRAPSALTSLHRSRSKAASTSGSLTRARNSAAVRLCGQLLLQAAKQAGPIYRRRGLRFPGQRTQSFVVSADGWSSRFHSPEMSLARGAPGSNQPSKRALPRG